jgi:hypothetical protein
MFHVKDKGDTSRLNNRDEWNQLKSFRKYLGKMPGKNVSKTLQKTY